MNTQTFLLDGGKTCREFPQAFGEDWQSEIVRLEMILERAGIKIETSWNYIPPILTPLPVRITLRSELPVEEMRKRFYGQIHTHVPLLHYDPVKGREERDGHMQCFVPLGKLEHTPEKIDDIFDELRGLGLGAKA